MPTDDERSDDASTNPFERWGIDPTQGPAAITERMRELAEDAEDDATRAQIRADWETLTLHPARRFREAVGAHPDSHGLLDGAPPRPPRRAAPPIRLSLEDVLLRPRVLEALGLDDAARAPLPDVPPERDPQLTRTDDDAGSRAR